MAQKLKKLSLWILVGCLLTACSGIPSGIPSGISMLLTVVDTSEIDPTCSNTCPTCPETICPTCAALATQISLESIVTLTPEPTTVLFFETPTSFMVMSNPTKTMEPSPSMTPTATIEPTATSTPEPKPFEVQTGSPVYMRNLYHTDNGCNWMGVGGQVLDDSGKWTNNVVIVVEGIVNGKKYDLLSLSGVASYFGPGGYDIQLSDQLFNSTDELSIVLNDLEGNILSNPYKFSTIADCNKNLVIINFQKISSP